MAILENSTERVLELILEAVNDLVDFELAVILKLFEDERLVVQKASGPLVNDDLHSFEINLRQRTDIARLLSINEPYLFEEHEEHMDTYAEVLDMPQEHSCLVAPLYVQNQPIGLMTFDHSVCGRFSPSIVRFIGTLSRLIAVIIDQNDSSLYLDAMRKNLTLERNLLLNANRDEFRHIIGDSPAWEIVLEQVKTVASSELPVLVQGETGTGKEQTARTVHELSPRREGPFITLNCSALNASLAESELFGHEKGAFTSALSQRKGRFEMADGGTLFLDEIGDLPPEIQPKILRTLQEGTFERIGGEKTLRCDVRIIAASNKDLRTEVREGRFREDLYYRLGVFPVFLPPLRERGQDVILLAEHFIRELKQREGKGTLSLHASAADLMVRHPWPGNVRELQNVIRRAALVAGGETILPRHLNLGAGPEEGACVEPADSEIPHNPGGARFPTLSEAERAHVKKALELCAGKVYGPGGAAELLDMKPTTLQSRIRKLGLKRE